MSVSVPAAVDVLRRSGGIVHLRAVGPADRDAVAALLARVSERSVYLRYFSADRRHATADLDRLTAPPTDAHLAVLASTTDGVVAIASLERLTAATGECALLVEDSGQGDGIGTLLLEELARWAHRAGWRSLEADALAENHLVLAVLRDLGPVVTEQREYGVVHVVVDLGSPDARGRLDRAVTRREVRAEVASLGRVLAPRSVAVVGAGSRPDSAGRQVLSNLLAGGYAGTLVAVNPRHHRVLGVPCVASVRDLPSPPDLAVVAVPRPAVRAVVEQCGEVGVRGVVVVTAGFAETGPEGRREQDELLAIARGSGMRLIGPNCLGIVDTDPGLRLNATFAAVPLEPGPVAVASQSGALGIALLGALHERGLGASQFVSLGNKADVSANDLLALWADDPRPRVVALYLESLGNPRRFVRIARATGDRCAVVVLKAGRTAAGSRAGASHTAARLHSDRVVDAVFDRAGALRTGDLAELVDVTTLLATQPAPRGPRIGVVGNSGGPEILTADATAARGLTLPPFSAQLREALRAVRADAASCTNPVDLGATLTPGAFRRAVSLVARSGEVDAVVAVFTPTSTTDAPAVLRSLGSVDCPADVTYVVVEVGGVPRRLGPRGDVPVFGLPESAVRALATAARRGRPTTQTPPPRPPHTDRDEAVRAIGGAAPGWLGPDTTARVLRAYGLQVLPQRVLGSGSTPADLTAAADAVGRPVALKAVGPVHKSDVGGVRLSLVDDAALTAAFADLCRIPGCTGVVVQPMALPGAEVLVGGLQDPDAGPVVTVGAGGVLTDLVADRPSALAPVSVGEARELLRAPVLRVLLEGARGRPPASPDAVADVVVRVGTLLDDLARVAELDLNPVVVRGTGVEVVDARVRIGAAAAFHDPLSRGLTGPLGPGD